MYEKLIADLREHAEWDKAGIWVIPITIIDDLRKAADAIESTNKAYQMISEAYEAEVTKQNWIPVTERLSDEHVNVLCQLRSLDRQSKYYSIDHLMEDGQWWKAAHSWKHDVTHWMPLPSAPTEE